MTDVINFEKKGSVGVITINNPPANAMSFAAKKGVSNLELFINLLILNYMKK